MLLSTVTRPFSSEELVEWREKVQKDSAKLLDMCKAAGTCARARARASRSASSLEAQWLAMDGWLARTGAKLDIDKIKPWARWITPVEERYAQDSSHLGL